MRTRSTLETKEAGSAACAGEQVVLGVPRVRDGAAIHALVAGCPPLDLNSVYAYLLLCEHFALTCVHAAVGGRTVGFVSGYRPPQREDVVFVWQVAVAAEQRGRGLAGAMLRELLARPGAAGCRYLETTVSPSNAASRGVFHRLAREVGAAVAERTLFDEQHFGGERHERETLISIGPIPGR